jgi:hypothetical protein
MAVPETFTRPLIKYYPPRQHLPDHDLLDAHRINTDRDFYPPSSTPSSFSLVALRYSAIRWQVNQTCKPFSLLYKVRRIQQSLSKAHKLIFPSKRLKPLRSNSSNSSPRTLLPQAFPDTTYHSQVLRAA